MENSEKAIDTEETPQSRQRKKVAKEANERKAAVKKTDAWYEISSGKLVRKTRMANGNLHTVYVCSANDKKNHERLTQLRKSGELRK